MPKQQHHPFQINGSNGKANHDVDKHRLNNQSGEVVDRRNMRLTNMDGSLASNKKIKGETSLYPNVDNSLNGNSVALTGDWYCIGTSEINNRIVEFWTDRNEVQPSLIRVDGLIVCMSSAFPISHDFPLQLDKNENCIGGEIYITDFNSQPMLFNIENMLEESGELGGIASEKYFTEFNINEHVLNLDIPLDRPAFIDLVGSLAGATETYGSQGSYIGYNQYSIRYATSEGDRTAWSPGTPLIPVVSNVSTASSEYTGIKTYGGESSTQTTLGCHIRFRVNNENNYDFVEIRRVVYKDGNLNSTGEVGVIGAINVTDGEISVVNILDKGGELTEVLDAEDDTITMSVIDKAKGIRYFNNKLYLFNLEYADRDITNKVSLRESVNNNAISPTIENIGRIGYNDVYNSTYKKEYMNGEKYGFGVKVYDANGERSFVFKLENTDTNGNDLNNYQFPNRREGISVDTSNNSYLGTVRAANETGGVSQTYEKFDLSDAQIKGSAAGTDKNIVDASSNPYGAYTPVSQSDSDVSGHDYNPTTEVNDGSSWQTYNPRGFSPKYFAQGVSFAGLDNLPDWAAGFSVVRTEPAKRVIAQGLGFYNMVSAGSGLGANTEKSTKTLKFFSPDLDADFASDPLLASDILNNPTNYEVEFVSPLGFFSEMYNGHEVDLGKDKGIDLMTYARIIRENSTPDINISETSNMGIGDGGRRYVTYGKYRSQSSFPTSGMFANKTKAIESTPLTGFNQTSNQNRENHYTLTVGLDVYSHSNTGGDFKFDDASLQDWHEPMYVINIIRKDANIATSETTRFVETGHYQNVRSVIGSSDGSDDQTFQIVDERWEDFLQDLEDPDSVGNALGSFYSIYDRFITIEKSNGDKVKWIDITWKDSSSRTTILDDITNNGFYVATDSLGTSVNVYGVYSVDIEDNRFFDVSFSTSLAPTTGYSDSLFIPSDDSVITIIYDKGLPLRVFGGDTWIGESIFCPHDLTYDKSGNPNEEFKLNVGFPYHQFEINPLTKIPKDPSGVDNYENDNTVKLNKAGLYPAYLRQLCVMFTCQSRSNVNFAYSYVGTAISDDLNAKAFPAVNYVMRPLKWKDNNFNGGNLTDIYETDNQLHAEYGTNYGHEYTLWSYGGIKFKPQPIVDYSHENNWRVAFSKPDELEVKNKFCTRGAWSLARPINVQDSPGVRTFLSTNIFDFTDDTGEIKYAFDDVSTSAGELTVFTDSGTIRAIVDKRLINELSGGVLSTVAADSTGILQQIVVDRNTGMSDEMWRSSAEYKNNLFFANHDSVFQYNSGQLKDIGRNGYHSRIYKDFLENIKDGYGDEVTGVYNTYHNEYWLGTTIKSNKITKTLETRILATNVDGVSTFSTTNNGIYEFNDITDYSSEIIIYANTEADVFYIAGANGSYSFTVRTSEGDALGTVRENEVYKLTRVANLKNTWTMELSSIQLEDVSATFVYSPIQIENGGWVGYFDYTFDKYLSFNNRTYGMRDLTTFELHKGSLINGSNIQGEIHVCSNEAATRGKEFIRVRSNSDNKPTSVEFYDNFENYRNQTISSSLDTVTNPFHLKNYDGFEGYVPRKDASYDANRTRQIGRYLIYKVIHNLDEDFEVSTIETQYKLIK